MPQGSPLSPFLFSLYVADIFILQLRYSPSVQTVVSNYVDDGVIPVASNSRDLMRYPMGEFFKDYYWGARCREIGFSAINTKWIRFG